MTVTSPTAMAAVRPIRLPNSFLNCYEVANPESLVWRVKLTAQARCEAEIQRVLERRGAMTKRDLQRNSNAEAAIFNPVLDSLLTLGSVTKQQDKLALAVD